MSEDMALALTNEMLIVGMKVAAPILGTALVVGLLISILQVVTQIQEMTLTFVPKILAVVFVIFVLGHWMLNMLANYSEALIKNIPAMF
jgi:flagellar biosynthetic protein FliQ